MRYIVIVFDGKKEHAYKSVVASSKETACAAIKEQHENRHGKLSRKLHSIEAFHMR